MISAKIRRYVRVCSTVEFGNQLVSIDIKKYLFFFQLQKLAREMSLLGNYETASVYYQGVIQQIHRLLATIDDPSRKQKWQLIQGEVVQEYDVVKNIQQTLVLFAFAIIIKLNCCDVYLYFLIDFVQGWRES